MAKTRKKRNRQQCNPPFDLTQLSQLLGTKPITAKIQKVAGRIQLRIEKPTNELLHKLGLRKSRNPNRDFTDYPYVVLVRGGDAPSKGFNTVDEATGYITALRRQGAHGSIMGPTGREVIWGKGKSPRVRNLPKFTDHVYGRYGTAQAADNAAIEQRMGFTRASSKGLVPASLYPVKLGDKWAVVGDSPNPRKKKRTRS
jgi:hypothetical protein